jgi:hypothetical protein
MRRTKSISTKITETEYARFVQLAEGQTLSEWVREVLLATATPRPADQVLLSEVLAVRTIVLNLLFAVASGEVPSTDAMKRLIERADTEKLARALERLGAASPGRTR